jgi:Tfp pilus assembly protein PilX
MKPLSTTQSKTTEQGFVLLFAIVVSAVIFFIGAGIFSISYKELIISSLAKDSQKSIFAADSAVECALQAYQDGQFDNSPVESFRCFGNSVIEPSNQSTGITTFRINFPENQSCAKVTIDDSNPDIITFFGQGYNKCIEDIAIPVSFPGLTERVYQVELGK